MLLRLGGVAYSTQEGAGMTIEISSVDITTTMLFFVCVIVSKSMMSCRVSCACVTVCRLEVYPVRSQKLYVGSLVHFRALQWASILNCRYQHVCKFVHCFEEGAGFAGGPKNFVSLFSLRAAVGEGTSKILIKRH